MAKKYSGALKKYSVLLMYPDYLAHQYGEETYLAHVKARDAKAAVMTAQKQAKDAQDDPEHVEFLPDFAPLLVCKGHIEDIKP